MAKKKNKVKVFPPPYYPGKVFHQDEVPNATPVSQLLKPPPYDPAKIFIAPFSRRSLCKIVIHHALNIAILLTTVACALWLAGYCYLRFVP
jgi:hypothetical protein